MADLDGGGELDQVELLLLLQRLRQKRGGTEERLSDAWAIICLRIFRSSLLTFTSSLYTLACCSMANDWSKM